MKTPNGKCTNWKWPKPKKTWKKQTKNREFWLAPPSKESRNSVFVCFFLFFVLFCVSKVLNKCGLLQGNWHESQAKLSKCLWERSKTSVKTSQNIILNHGKTALPGAAVLKKYFLHCTPRYITIHCHPHYIPVVSPFIPSLYPKYIHITPLIYSQYGSVSKPCTPGEHQNSW